MYKRQALIGSILIASLVSNFQTGVLANPALAGVSEEIAATAEANANFVTTDQVRTSAEQAGLSTAQADALVAEYAESQITALRVAFAGIALFALLAFAYVHRLPKLAVPPAQTAP